jgi:hypothetical protein
MPGNGVCHAVTQAFHLMDRVYLHRAGHNSLFFPRARAIPPFPASAVMRSFGIAHKTKDVGYRSLQTAA